MQEISMLEEIEILFWYDGPVLFTAEVLEQVRLVTLIDITDTTMVYMVSSPSEEMILAMADNLIPLRDVSNVGPFYRVISHGHGGPTLIEAIDAWPEGMLPAPGVLLSLASENSGEQNLSAPTAADPT